jgi:protein-S-isoprenylcysteine O-methyltransferase Ste14
MSAPTLWQIEMIPWYALLLYWGISSLAVKNTKVPEDSLSRSQHLVFMLAAILLMFTDYLRMGLLARRFVPEDVWIRYGAIAVTGCGVAVAIVARYNLGQYWSARVEVKVDHRLICSGPYAWVRHPIYSGILLAIVGTGLFVGEWRAALAIVFAITGLALKARKEESLMTAEFGELYEEYRRRTGFLIPRFY